MSKKLLRGQPSQINFDEFKALVKNFVPTSLEQAEWICNVAERILREHPELWEKIEEWMESSDEETEEAKRLIASILKEIHSERVNAGKERKGCGKGMRR